MLTIGVLKNSLPPYMERQLKNDSSTAMIILLFVSYDSFVVVSVRQILALIIT